MPADAAPSTLPVRRPYLPHVLAGAVLVAALLAVFGYARVMRDREVRAAEAAFDAGSAQAVALLRQRLLAPELLVRGGAVLPVGDGGADLPAWARQAGALDLARRFPEVRAFGFAAETRAGQVESGHQANLPTFADRVEARALVQYVAPDLGADARLAGIDLLADLRRREAMEQAATSGAPRMSLPVPAPGAAADAAADGIAWFAPVYASDGGPAARDSLRGWAFAQVDLARLLAPLPAQVPGLAAFWIVDATGGGALPVHGRAATGTGEDAPAFVRRSVLDIAGRRWDVAFASPPLAQLQAGVPGLRALQVVGVLGALLLAAFVFATARTQARVEALAGRMGESWRRGEQRFRSAMQYSPIGKALLDRGGRILDANPALAQLLGTTREALIGSLFGAHFADDESIRTIERNVEAGSPFRTTRRLRRSDGEVRHVGLSFASLPGESGDEVASLVQVDDVTERMRAEARVQSLNRTLESRVALRTRELSQANRELEAFADSVSHDLRAPLRAIDGFARLLGERYSDAIDAHGRDYLARIEAAAGRMGELIDGLVRVSHASRGELHRQPLDLSQLAQAIADELQAGEPAREVEVAVAPELQAVGDAALVRTLLEALMGNAWKFTRGREHARIDVGRDGDGFFVRDNGVGFAPAQADRLFRPFQRLHPEGAFAGHGIGLAQAKRIVERHGGSLHAEGREGAGATFRFTLPPAATGIGMEPEPEAG